MIKSSDHAYHDLTTVWWQTVSTCVAREVERVSGRSAAKMADPTKQEIAQVFKRLRTVGPNKVRRTVTVGSTLKAIGGIN